MTGPVFRRARREDLSAIIGLLADDELGRSREQVSDPPLQAYEDAFRRVAADERNFLAVAELDGVVVGTLHLTFIPGLSNQGADRALIEDVRVASALRGRGIGGRMVGWALDEARRRDCLFVELFTHESRQAAQAFYVRLGFEASHVGMRLRLD